MPQRCRDVFAWWRLVMGPAGPAPITRLVLCAHVLFMDRDGGNCRVGVRRLAMVTGLNKNTVAKHRADAIKIGWLVIVVRSSRTRTAEIQASVPDNISDHPNSTLSCETGQSVSSAAGHATSISRSQVYGRSDSTVPFQTSHCPAGRDIPLISLLPLRSGVPERLVRANSARAGWKERRKLQAVLQSWLLNDKMAQKYTHDADTLARLTPLEWRFPGYEEFIQQQLNRAPDP